LKALTKIKVYKMFRSVLREGICLVGELTFTNVYKDSNRHIISLDVNLVYLYGRTFAMSVGGFEWVTPKMKMIMDI